MSTLKEQYALRKKDNEQRKLGDATQLLESHYLILEKLDTASIGRVIDAMNAIEQGLAPFTQQVPAFKQALDAAEADLTKLVSGRAGNDPKKVNAILGKALGLYQGLSEFFRADLPQLLKLPMFKAVQTGSGNEMKPLSAVPGINANALQGAFVQALAIRQEGGFLKKLAAMAGIGTNMPYMDNKALAQQMMSLSYENLQKLSGLSKMPALADQSSVQQAAAAAVGAPAGGAQQPGAAAVPGAAPAGAQAAPAAGGATAHPNAPEMRKALSAFVAPDKLDAALAALTKAVTA